MIAFLRGKLIAKTSQAAVVECGGVGYEVFAPLTVIEKMPAAGAEVFIHTDFVVREDSQTLYGFLDERSRAVFRRLIKVSGVGAKTAVALMSALSAEELLSALAGEDATRLTCAPGIGQKTAERIVLDFRGSPLLDDIGGATGGGDKTFSAADRDIEQGLAALGYKKAEIARAIAALPKNDDADPAARLRAALQKLSGRG